VIYGPSKLYAIIVVTIVLNYCVICYLSIHWIVSEHLSLRNKNSGYNFQVYWFVFSTFAVHMNTLCWYNIERLLRYVILTLPCYAFMYFFWCCLTWSSALQIKYWQDWLRWPIELSIDKMPIAIIRSCLSCFILYREYFLAMPKNCENLKLTF